MDKKKSEEEKNKKIEDKNILHKTELEKKKKEKSEIEENCKLTDIINKISTENSVQGIVTAKLTGEAVYVNEAAGLIIGATKEQIYKQNFHEIKSWKKFGIYENVLKAIETKKQTNFDVKLITSFGKELWLNFKLIPFTFEEEDYILFIFNDISNEKMLARNENLFRNLVYNQGEGVGLSDLNEVFLFANPAAVKIFGVGDEGLKGRNIQEFVSKKTMKIIKLQTEKRLNKETSNYEIPIIQPSGKEIDIMITATPRIHEGEVVGTLAIFRDITKLKENQKKINKKNKELRNINETKDFLFSILAHDLRSPFNSILGLSQLLTDNYETYNDASKLEFLKLINKSAENTYILLENLLTWSRSQRNIIKYYPLEFSADEYIEKAVKNISQNAKCKEIKIINKADKKHKVYADRETSDIIIRNLLSNAVKFSYKESNILIFTKKIKVKKNEMVEFCISDKGIGIDEQTIKNLFKRKKIKVKKGTEEEKGSGLGLDICKTFVKKNGGKMRVENNPEGGCNFYFTLPCV